MVIFNDVKTFSFEVDPTLFTFKVNEGEGSFLTAGYLGHALIKNPNPKDFGGTLVIYFAGTSLSLKTADRYSYENFVKAGKKLNSMVNSK